VCVCVCARVSERDSDKCIHYYYHTKTNGTRAFVNYSGDVYIPPNVVYTIYSGFRQKFSSPVLFDRPNTSWEPERPAAVFQND